MPESRALPPLFSMPPSSSSTRPSTFPSSSSRTYRDLLLFEERLKSNNAHLQRRKSRYILFLCLLLLTICSLLLPRYPAPLFTLPYQIRIPLLFVGLTTLILFFASGMYTEKIGYANKYVPHANKTLRSFNMNLNVRLKPFLPFPSFHASPTTNTKRRTDNPRGELIFSSRVNKSFREGYERYRGAFEKKREERNVGMRRRWWWWRKT